MSALVTTRQQRIACPFHAASLLVGYAMGVVDECDRLGFSDMAHVHEHLRNKHYHHMPEEERDAVRYLFSKCNQRVPGRDKWYRLFRICAPDLTPPDSHYHFLLSDFLNAFPNYRGALQQENLLLAFVLDH
ncbi:uncharacterized protein PG986_004511 [Apiospora aurea]|uniref:Uncharacterized protein n=1 Tax=Apiospora aurea TaxID=335848 RepID=A0ABR1QMT7_9PEZI